MSITGPQDRLEYPTEILKMANGCEVEKYIIPEEDKQKVLDMLYPYRQNLQGTGLHCDQRGRWQLPRLTLLRGEWRRSAGLDRTERWRQQERQGWSHHRHRHNPPLIGEQIKRGTTRKGGVSFFDF